MPRRELPEDGDPRGVSLKATNGLGSPTGPATLPALRGRSLASYKSGDRQEVATEPTPCSGLSMQHEGIGD